MVDSQGWWRESVESIIVLLLVARIWSRQQNIASDTRPQVIPGASPRTRQPYGTSVNRNGGSLGARAFGHASSGRTKISGSMKETSPD